MAVHADDLRREAMTLSEEARAGLAADLLSSLGDSGEGVDVATAEWDAEMLRRAEAVEAGEVATESWKDVRERLLAKRSV